MFKKALLPMLAVGAILGSSLSASAMPKSHSMLAHHAAARAMMGHGIYAKMKTGPDHGMPDGTAGEGPVYTGAPDLQAAISLVVAGGAPKNFSIVKAIAALAGRAVANAEVAKLTKQYGSARVGKYVSVQNFAVNDAVRIALAAGVKFPKPMLRGAALAKRVVGLGLVNGTYYEGTQLDRLVSHKIHEAVMVDIDRTFGREADANYHLISNQAHYDLAHVLGVTSVKLAAYH